VEGTSLLKNPLGARFRPGLGTKQHQTCWFLSFSSSICGRKQLDADFFNRLERPYSITYAERPAKHCLPRAY
jgi:hypothetical protein